MCAFRSTPMKVIGKPTGEGILKGKIVKEKYPLKLTFPWGWRMEI